MAEMTTTQSSIKCDDDNDAMIFRYNSPFFPIKENDQRNSTNNIPSALIILNTPIKSRIDTNNNSNNKNSNNKGATLSGVLGVLWETSSYRICADGGANRLYDATIAIAMQQDCEDQYADSTTTDTTAQHYSFLPDLITGDLDSIRPEVRQFYESRGVSIVRVEDQNYHDLDVSDIFTYLYFVYLTQFDSTYLIVLKLATHVM